MKSLAAVVSRVFCCALPLAACPVVSSAEIPTAQMPPAVLSVLAALPANTNHLSYETNDLSPRLRMRRGQESWSYEQALGFLRNSHFPDILRFARVKASPPARDPRLLIAGTTNQFVGLWTTTNAQGEVSIVPADFQPLAVVDFPGLNLAPGDFREELQALTSVYMRHADPAKLTWNFNVPFLSKQLLWTDSKTLNPQVLVHEVLCGLWLGMTNELSVAFDSAWLRLALTNGLAGYMRMRAKSTWEAGLAKLQAGRALADVLEAWREHAGAFGINVVPEIREYVTTLEDQAGEFERLRSSTVEDSLSLPPEQRASYLIDRLSQARRSEKGIGTFRAGAPAPELVAVGRAALPALAAHLDDRRITRVTGDHYTTVVLVQDLVLDCFEQIAGGSVRTNYQTFDRFSVLAKAERDDIAGRVRSWMALYANKHEAFGNLALNEWKPMTRLFRLEELASRYPGVLNSRDYLTRWAAEGKTDELPALAWRLASLGDRSLLPKICDRVRTGDHRGGECLTAFGDPADFLAVRDSIRRNLVATNTAEILSAHILLHWVAEIGEGTATNRFTPAPYALPILLDAVESRRLTPAGSSPKTLADVAFPACLILTGHTSDYASNAPIAKRLSSIDSWTSWWETEGRTAFSNQHPEVKSLFGRLDPEDGLDAPNRLPNTILTTPFEPGQGKEGWLRREEAVRLAKEGKLRLRVFGNVALARSLNPSIPSPASK
jgi:hypothetical protein